MAAALQTWMRRAEKKYLGTREAWRDGVLSSTRHMAVGGSFNVRGVHT
ncbi:hypothetical protein M3J09_001856 [Ascochyta lentis]